jgi:hypothetical protein
MKRTTAQLLATFALAALPVLARGEQVASENRVDFRYAQSWWQSTICLLDDSDKTVVGKEGRVLLDWGSGWFRNYAICLEPEIVGGAKWLRQQTASPRAPVVQTWKDAAGVEVLEETFVVTPKLGQRQVAADKTRRIVVLMTLRNTTGAAAVRQPALHIHSVAPVQFSAKDGIVMAGKDTRIAASGRVEAGKGKSKTDFTLLLPPVTLAPGASQQVAFTIERRGDKSASALTTTEAGALRDAARCWWETADLPFETVQIPDAGVQAVIESSVRNIWQAREILRGKPAYHIGPTSYRSLAMVDDSFIYETLCMLGRERDARDGIEYFLGHQEADGSFQLIYRYNGVKGFWKENGIMLWAACRHAQLLQDKAWLRAKWPALKRIVEAIRRVRKESYADPASLGYGLLPGGYIDGGLDNKPPGSKPEYSNIHWTLTGLKAAITAARWLGDARSAAAWQKEYDEFYGMFRKATARDTLKDPSGNAYVPTMMGNVGGFPPQKGQWAFCQAVYPGQIFPAGDSMVEGQLAMLRAAKVEGLVFDTGWLKDGLWTYFASFYAHAVLWMGHGDEAAQVLYDFANHAAPTRVWREEQKPVGKGVEEVGDMPHNWASAEFIRLTTHLLELDRGDELHLLEGMPAQWLKAGMTTKLNGVQTPFGSLRMTVQVDQQGRTATLEVKPLNANCKSVVVHLPDGTLRRLPPVQGGTLTFNTHRMSAN